MTMIPDEDDQVIALMVAEYVDWLNGHGGASAEELRKRPLSPSQLQRLQTAMAEALTIHQLAQKRKPFNSGS